MSEKQNRFARAGSAQTNDNIHFLRRGATDENIGIGKACGLQSPYRRLDDGSCGAGRESGLNFDEFLVDIAGELFFSLGTRGLWRRGRG